MGFPIQKFPDQSLFAAPRDLSQRTTSFIASQRQGIHRIPLRHLIALEIRKRTLQVSPRRFPPLHPNISKRPALLQTHPGARGQARLTTGMLIERLRRQGATSVQAFALPYSSNAVSSVETGCASSSRCQFAFARAVRAKPVGISIPQGR